MERIGATVIGRQTPGGFGCTVVGPESDRLNPNDLRALLPADGFSETRWRRTWSSRKMAVQCGSELVGVAVYRQREHVLEVDEIATSTRARCAPAEIVSMLLHALEAACLAGGGHRILIRPDAARAVSSPACFGYTLIGPMARGCLEKTLL